MRSPGVRLPENPLRRHWELLCVTLYTPLLPSTHSHTCSLTHPTKLTIELNLCVSMPLDSNSYESFHSSDFDYSGSSTHRNQVGLQGKQILLLCTLDFDYPGRQDLWPKENINKNPIQFTQINWIRVRDTLKEMGL